MTGIPTPSEIVILRTTLGLNRGTIPYRNHMFVSDGHYTLDTLTTMTKKGLMREHTTSITGSVLFSATAAGCRACGLSGLDAIGAD